MAKSDLQTPLVDDLPRSMRRAWAIVALACLTGGCEALGPEWSSKPIGADQSPIHFDHADFDARLAEYALQQDLKSGNAVYVAHFAGAGATGVVAAFKAGPSYVVEERATETYVAPLLAEAHPVWGASGRSAAHGSPISYRMFRMPGQTTNCVGFAQLIGQPADDANHKKAIVFGYFCKSDPRPISASAAEDLISAISLTR